jgi:type II secretory pathway pseudopilin PulG
VAIIGIISAIAVPGLLRARISGNEASAIASLRIVNSSQQAYASSCGNGFFASSLTILAEPAPVGAPFISPDLGTAAIIDKSGYRLEMQEGSEASAAARDGCNPSGVAAALFTSYYAMNSPLMAGQSNADDFAAATVGNAPPGAGTALQ